MVPRVMILVTLLGASPDSMNRSGVLDVVHYRTEDKLINLAVRVNDSPPLTFVLDSGARHSIIDSTTAVALGLRTLSPDSTAGVGKGAGPLQHNPPPPPPGGAVAPHLPDPRVVDPRPGGPRPGPPGGGSLG